MKIEFEKWQGTKNDFVLTWLLGDDPIVFDSLKRQAPQVCRRDGTGVGADGLLILHISKHDQVFPNRLSIINADGSIAETCGNGIRCAALSILKRSHELQPTELVEGFNLPLKSSAVDCRFIGNSDATIGSSWPLVTVAMGVPKINGENEKFPHVEQELDRIAKALQLPQLLDDWAFIDIGNEHLVFFLPEADRDLLHRVGPACQISDYWDGINVHLAVAKDVDPKLRTQIANRLGTTIEDLYQVLVWERGAGETQACGSGACAVARAAMESGLVARQHWLGIEMPGGLLFTQQQDVKDPMNLAGPAAMVFSGLLEI